MKTTVKVTIEAHVEVQVDVHGDTKLGDLRSILNEEAMRLAEPGYARLAALGPRHGTPPNVSLELLHTPRVEGLLEK